MVKNDNSAERDKRFKRTREAMESEGIEGLLIAGKGHMWTGRGYIRYFTDFHMWGHDALMLLPLDDDPTLAVTSYGVANMIENQGWIKDTRGACNLCDFTPPIIDAIHEKGLKKSKIGIVGMDWILPAGAYQKLQKSLPKVQFVNSDELLDKIRMTKSTLEIKQMRKLWDLSKRAMERFLDVLEPGKTGWELAAEACRVTRAGGASEELVFLNESGVQGPPKNIPVKCNDVIQYHMEICGPSGHYSEITIMCAYREPTELELKLMDSELEAYDKIMEIAKPGIKISELAQTFDKSLIEDGWKFGPPKKHFDFHGQGLDSVERPWWDEAQPCGQENWELTDGTVLCYHPSRTMIPKVSKTGICDDIVITANGAERLSGNWELRWLRMDK
jgi:Xaa-Pro aminopeptidase